ncbi:MAG: O-acetylhomoserine aminocarboxypropyltransferase/cysteine synthase family protein [Spirochaetota bacterium]
MSDKLNFNGFETRQIHAGAAPDSATGALQTPIYQSTSFAFNSSEHAAKLFALKEVGYIYSRLTNPTVFALQNRVAALEGGAGAVGTSSGHAAQIMALFPLLSPGKNVVASSRLYGGTVTQFSHTIRRFGWEARLVDFEDLDAVRSAIDENTRALFFEPIANPGGYVVDLEAIARIADAAGIPIVTDNTTATPYLLRPIDYGATIVVHSATKFLTGNATVTGGVVVDSGKFDWAASGKFPALSQPVESYHGVNFQKAFGPLAFTFYGIAVGLRDLGMTMNPQGAHYTLLGLETLSLRMRQHVENATEVARWLERDPRVEGVSYAGLESSPYYRRGQRYLPKGQGSLFTFSVKGGYEAAKKVVDHVQLFSHVANLGDSRSLIIHPASTTHSQLSEEQLLAAGAASNQIRLSVGLETVDDLLRDLDNALAQATA